MLRIAIIAVAALGLIDVQILHAGLYCVEKPLGEYPVPRKGVQDIPPQRFREGYLPELRQISAPLAKNNQGKDAESLQEKYTKRKRELEMKRRGGSFSIEDRINLSFYLIRLNLLDEAMQLLREPEAQRSNHFMVFSNLATIYQMRADTGALPDRLGNLRQALGSLSIARQMWPRGGWPGWSKEQNDWYLKVEKYNTALVRLRLKEAGLQVGRGEGGPPPEESKAFEKVDDLFPLDWAKDKKKPLSFVGKEGRYEAGGMAEEERAKLKGDEIGIVQQLLTWLPNDVRLYWLWGELLNAQGDVALAAGILEECVSGRNVSNVPLLRDHRNVLREAKAIPPKPASTHPSWLPDTWQWLVVGGLGGLLIAIFVYFQVREIHRRRLARKK